MQGGKHLRKLPRRCVLSKNCSAGFCATGDLVSACSLAFLDGPTGLYLKFTVALHLQRQEVRQSSPTSLCSRSQERRAQFRSSSEDSTCSLIQGS